jgi:hypothetical protein
MDVEIKFYVSKGCNVPQIYQIKKKKILGTLNSFSFGQLTAKDLQLM